MELAETGGSLSREELILVEVVPSPDLRREYSEPERFRVGFLGFGVIRFSLFGSLRCSSSWSDSAGSCHGWARGGFLRVGEIPVPIRRYQECSGTVLVLEARLTADVIVVKVSCSIPHVCVSGYVLMGRQGGFKTHHNSFGTLILGVLFSFFSGSLATTSLEEFKSLGLNCCGARESFAVSESASRQCSHPGAVVFYGGVADFLAASAYSFWESVQASCGASFIPALVALARHCYVLELSPLVILSFIDRESYELCGDHRELATPETLRELPASEKTRRTSHSRELC
ncbi:hypothetical protein HID58_079488 [Brassica napus]|uniref:Uncharacterized protein n=1 Tax=Brassica napus TaxID=3708 RepID=A0ABQ7Y258_BRANA|nr:hypothetical protein HID58_079488 [Brassica napus]